ncbi:esterase D [Salpingoeca rosetta]|uniref:S-formylglutathione hydrolase n=1 Tax=Salpingoeca rosetta (strain ATCC 50818 / BSB-021) TaxID=946362 RepID=F2UIM5_SALR5|nr:esterase D [Salpingoeca rosetta]EGD77074.1 esterase D [Salpingoeca rosetta]|eukprot:XP_004990914.1 esterase D [Salpingoeca rosetta]
MTLLRLARATGTVVPALLRGGGVRLASSKASGSDAALEIVARSKSFGGYVTRYRHYAETLKCDMGFAVYTPPVCETDPAAKCPTMYWLSGLTCDDTNFITKAGAQKYLAENNLMVVCPDTSPRGCNLPGEDDAYDFGTGAGFYISATTEHYKDHYHMYEYITQELPSFVEQHLPALPAARSILGHSMGGLGALNLYLKNPTQYKTVSAFSPICNPINCAWGQKAFRGYLGDDEATWQAWDPCMLLSQTDLDALPEILISQGLADEFLESQLRPSSLPKHKNIRLEMHEGYDHSYYFIASFIEQHIKHHAAALTR